MAESAIDISVVIPTRNRRDLLRETIESLWRQTFPADRFEVIVVDNLSSDGTATLMVELQESSPCSLRYQVMQVNRGPAHSRNTGARMARGSVLAFTDSDCRLVPDWLEIGWRALQSPVAFVSGPVLNKPEQEPKLKFFSRAQGGFVDEHPSYPTQNILYRKSLFIEFGGFDENLCYRDFRNRPVECADVDLAWQLLDAGYSNSYERGLICYHEIEMQRPIDWVLEPFRLFVVPALIARHPALRKQLLHRGLFFFFPDAPIFYLAVAGAAGALFLSPWLLLLSVPHVYRTATLRAKREFSWDRIPRTLARILLLTANQAVAAGGFLYGSIRFRALVL